MVILGFRTEALNTSSATLGGTSAVEKKRKAQKRRTYEVPLDGLLRTDIVLNDLYQDVQN